MAFPEFAPPNTTGVLARVSAAVAKTLAPIVAKTHLDSQILEGVALTAGAVNQVPHRLGRRLRTWKDVRKRADARLWDSQDTGKSPDRFLYLNTSADVVVDLEVS